MPVSDPIWDDLAALAFELLAKPDDRPTDPVNADGDGDADQREGEK
jgi:hypothetical protein